MSSVKTSLPAGWKWIYLGEVCEFIRGVSFDKANSFTSPKPGYLPILRAGNIGRTLDLLNDLIYVPSQKISVEQRLRVGDIVVCMSSGSPTVVGKSAQLKKPFNGSVGAFCGIIRTHILEQSEYVAYWLNSSYFKEWRNGQARGANIQNLRFSEFQSILIPFPPIHEQRHIVAILDKQMISAEGARGAAEAQLEATKALSTAYLRDVFNSPEAQQWPKICMGEVGEIISGVALGRKITNENTRLVPYLRVANVKDGHLNLSSVFQVEATEAEIKKCRLKFGDLLLTEGGDPDKLGRGTYWEEQIPECIHQNHIFRVRFDLEKYLPQFISAQVSSPYGKAYFLANAKQTTGIATINKKVLTRFPLMVTSLSVQKRIASMLNKQLAAVERARKALEEQLDTINKLPDALLRRAFRGEL